MAGGLRLSSLMPHRILFMWPTLVTPRSCNESTATLMPGSKPGHGATMGCPATLHTNEGNEVTPDGQERHKK